MPNPACFSQPSYLNNLISDQPPRSTRSSSVVTLSRPPTISLLKITDRSFRYASPRLWNQLPDSFRQPRQSCLDSPPHFLTASSSIVAAYRWSSQVACAKSCVFHRSQCRYSIACYRTICQHDTTLRLTDIQTRVLLMSLLVQFRCFFCDAAPLRPLNKTWAWLRWFNCNTKYTINCLHCVPKRNIPNSWR